MFASLGHSKLVGLGFGAQTFCPTLTAKRIRTVFRQQLLRSLLGTMYFEKAIRPPSAVLGLLTCLGMFRRHEFGTVHLMDRGPGWGACQEIPYYTKKWACDFE